MSAYVVDPRTIDYLVAWAERRSGRREGLTTRRLFVRLADAPAALQHALTGSEDYGYRLDLNRLTPDAIGSILMDECVRSVSTRYPNDEPGNLPGPTPQHPDFARIRSYRFEQIPAQLRSDWVVKSCDCLAYQSCETEDWEQTVAHAVMEAIRERAIDEWTDGAPWGVTDEDLQAVSTGAAAAQLRMEGR